MVGEGGQYIPPDAVRRLQGDRVGNRSGGALRRPRAGGADPGGPGQRDLCRAQGSTTVFGWRGLRWTS